MINIQISRALYERLLALTVSFEDTPEIVIERLLSGGAEGAKPLERKAIFAENATPIKVNNLDEAEMIFPLAKKVFESFEIDAFQGRREMNNAINHLYTKIGMHKVSSRIYIDSVRCMKHGKSYKRAINKTATKYFLQKIYDEDGAKGLKTALTGLWGHIEYRENDGINSRGIKAIYTEFTLMLKPDAKICPECGYIFFNGNGWEGLDGHWNAKHAKATNMSYTVAGPMIKSGKYKSPKR